MSYQDLHIYRESMRLALEIHRISVRLPKFETYEVGSQIRRSSKAITSLIVEGYGRRRYKADFIKFLVYAHAECDETIVHLTFLFQSGSWSDEEKFS
jgi:four helix bundle protein